MSITGTRHEHVVANPDRILGSPYDAHDLQEQIAVALSQARACGSVSALFLALHVQVTHSTEQEP